MPLAALIAAVAVVWTSAGAAAQDSQKSGDDSNFNSTSERFHEEAPRPGVRTIRYWTGHSVNPVDGLTYTYDIVGADPAAGRAATVGVDIIPLNVTVAGRAFNGSDTKAAILASPLFKRGSYATATAATTFNPATGFGTGSGGALSAGNTNVQLLDATMRSQFNKVGTGYHLYLKPEFRRPVTIDVPAIDGLIRTNPATHIGYAAVDNTWFQPLVESLIPQLHLNPQRLAVFLTNDVVLFSDHNPAHCCEFGAHGSVPSTSRPDDEGDGRARPAVQTFVWASWMTAGFFSLNPIQSWAKQDISGLSHEITEWANNPFGTNAVATWKSPTAPQYRCSSLLETGDPTANIGFSIGVNTFDQNDFSDGTYHPQDEAFLPWFMRTSPNHVSQPTQSNPAVGRYTFMGDLNPFPFFHQPAAQPPPPPC
jgi:hypothetical protein